MTLSHLAWLNEYWERVHNHVTPLILASASPRREELLKRLLPSSFPVKVVPSLFAEDLDKMAYSTPEEYVEATAVAKLDEVYNRLSSQGTPPALVLAADTIVVFEGDIMEKPTNVAHARTMLQRLSGKTHQVMTAIVLSDSDRTLRRVITTHVTFGDILPAVLESYLAHPKEYMDKAGAYGIQGLAGALFVSGIEGDFYNVVGLPLYALTQLLHSWVHNK